MSSRSTPSPGVDCLTPRLGASAMSGRPKKRPKGKTPNGGPARLVGLPKVCPAKKAMKRRGNLFSQIIDRDNIELAYYKARKGKAWQRTVKRIDNNRDEALSRLQNDLGAERFTTSPYKIKKIYEPKERDIYILPFYPDRIVQHALMNVLESIWTPLFIYDSYACIPGRGLHAGSRRTMEFVRRYKYFLKCDISKFYPSINHDIMYSIVEQKIKCKPTLRLIRDVIYSIPGGRNVPIGNYTSQWKGNLYLNELDMFIKQRLRVKGYIRYCDDFCLFSNYKQELQKWRDEIRGFLWNQLKLCFSKAELAPVSQGVDFLGYRHFPNKILLRKSTARRVRRRLAKLPHLYRSGRINLEQYRSSIASTWGWLQWANTYNFRIAIQLQELQEDVDGLRHTEAVQ